MIIPPVTPEYDTSAQAKLNEVLTKSDEQNFKLDQDNFLTTGSICLQDSVGDWFKIGVNPGGGSGYVVSDSLTIPNSIIGGSSNATCTVTAISNVAVVTVGSLSNIFHHEDFHGIHINVPLGGGSGSGAKATVSISDESLISVAIVSGPILTITKLAGTQIDADGRPSIASTNPYS